MLSWETTFRIMGEQLESLKLVAARLEQAGIASRIN